MLYVFTKNEEYILNIADFEFENDNHVREINGKWTFEFETSIDYLPYLSKSTKVGFYDKNHRFQLFFIDEEPNIDYLTQKINVYCLNICFELSTNITEDKRLQDGSALDAMKKALEGSAWEVGNVANLGTQNINFYDINRMDALKEIVKKYGGELDFRIELDNTATHIAHKYVDLPAHLGEETGLRWSFDVNLESASRKDVSETFCNVLYGRGGSLESGDGYTRKIKFKDIEWHKPDNPIDKPLGQSYIEDQDSINKYGRVEAIFENGNIKEPEELLFATYQALQENKNPKFSYEAKVKDISNQKGFEHYKVNLGDSIIIIDEELKLNNKARIVAFSESIKESENEKKLTLGNIEKSFMDKSNSTITIVNSSNKNEDIVIDDTKFPNELPNVPEVEAQGLFASIIILWTYDPKIYYEYELYASKSKGFNPTADNLIAKGRFSTFLHEVKPDETWYYRVRCRNTHDQTTEFSAETNATALKIADGTEYIANAAIGDACIGTLRLDRGWVGKLLGQFIEAKNLLVTTSTGERITLHIDDVGRVFIDAEELLIKGEKILNQAEINEKLDEINDNYNNAINDIKNETNEIYQQFNNATSDDVLSSHEKIQMREELRNLDSQYNSIKLIIEKFNDESVNSQFAQLTEKWQAIHEFLDPFLVDVNSASEVSNATIRELLYQYLMQYNITNVALQTFISTTLTTIRTQLTTTAEGMQIAITNSNEALDEVNKIGKHFRFTDSGWFELFATINGEEGPFKARLSDTRLSFLENNVEVSYFSNYMMLITSLKVLNSLQIGNISLSKTATGGIIMKWIGDDD